MNSHVNFVIMAICLCLILILGTEAQLNFSTGWGKRMALPPLQDSNSRPNAVIPLNPSSMHGMPPTQMSMYGAPTPGYLPYQPYQPLPYQTSPYQPPLFQTSPFQTLPYQSLMRRGMEESPQAEWER